MPAAPGPPALTTEQKAASEGLRRGRAVTDWNLGRSNARLVKLGLAAVVTYPDGSAALRPVATGVLDARGRDHKTDRKDPGLVYVGRGNRFTGHRGSVLQNKYKGDTPESALDAVRSYARDLCGVLAADVDPGHRPPADLLRGAYAVAVREALAACRGKTVVCWCVTYDGLGPPPETPCHAVCVARAADGLDPLPEEWR